MRLFTAVYPTEAALAHLDLALDSVFGGLTVGAGLRWSPREQRHITLGFHGEVPEGLVEIYLGSLADLLADLADSYSTTTAAALFPGNDTRSDQDAQGGRTSDGSGGFQMALAGAGVFGGRSLWVGVGEGLAPVQQLCRLVNEAAESVGIRPDQRAGSRPHLTLARACAKLATRKPRHRKGDPPAWQQPPPDLGLLEGLAHALALYQGPTFQVTEVRVVKSTLGAGRSGGSLYETIATIPLP